MLKTKGYAVKSADSGFGDFEFERRELNLKDVLIEILYCGVCHTDIHYKQNDWGQTTYPLIPGHEIVGRIADVGAEVTKFKKGDYAGVGCFVDSCGTCKNCLQDVEQCCQVHLALTYNGTEMDKKTPTFGGYSSQIVASEDYTLKISDTENLAAVAPLLCAGITTYSPLKRFNVREGQKVGVVGLGGLGHIGVKLAASMGAEVTVFSTSPDKEKDAKKLGAKHFVVTKNPENLEPLTGTFDFILDTVSASHDLNVYLNLLGLYGTLCVVGILEKPAEIGAFPLIINNRSLVGSGIGGIKETQEMLDYCAENNIISEIEMIPIQKIEEAYERTLKADVRYRFVIDMQSL